MQYYNSESFISASIGTVATIVGCLMCGPLLDKLGRKWTLLSVNIPFIIGWIILWVAPRPASTPLLYLGRILTGLGGGMVSHEISLQYSHIPDINFISLLFSQVVQVKNLEYLHIITCSVTN